MSVERFVVTIHGNTKHNEAYASFEHLKRKSQGGKFTRENIVLAHASCNRNRDKRKYAHDPYPIKKRGPSSQNRAGVTRSTDGRSATELS